MRLDGRPGVEVVSVSAQGTRCATGCLRRGSQPRVAAMPHGPLPGVPRPTEAAGPESKVWKSGIVGYGLVPAAHRVSVDKINTIQVESLVVGQFGQREGVVCVAGPTPTSPLPARANEGAGIRLADVILLDVTAFSLGSSPAISAADIGSKAVRPAPTAVCLFFERMKIP